MLMNRTGEGLASAEAAVLIVDVGEVGETGEVGEVEAGLLDDECRSARLEEGVVFGIKTGLLTFPIPPALLSGT